MSRQEAAAANAKMRALPEVSVRKLFFDACQHAPWRSGIPAGDGRRQNNFLRLLSGVLCGPTSASDKNSRDQGSGIAAALSRCARKSKSTVLPALSTARYKYFHWPTTLT
ncbi:hypothetical protein AB6809_34550 [Paraburkholderia sp. RCC_158]|uniref:hypothetical protein n=1 Tax=Paraburkholderia sp. RCC_158 TaxID=3239220 RepID=UPI00352543A5